MSDADTYLTEHPEEFNDETGAYNVSLFNDYRLEQIKEAKEKVKYTLNLTLTKVDDEWRLDDLVKSMKVKFMELINIKNSKLSFFLFENYV